MPIYTIEIVWLNDHQTVKFAAQELKRYLYKTISNTEIKIRNADKYEPSESAEIWIGLGQCFLLDQLYAASGDFDDAIYVDMNQAGGIIAGNNARSVLLAVYRYLSELGFRWLRPGPDGEVIPSQLDLLKPVHLFETPSYRHRGICIEGAVSYEHIRDIIDWMPKVGFNSYFVQFREGYTFFDRWYSHIYNPTITPEPFSIKKAQELIKRAEGEIKKRDLIYHKVGHGWTCEPLGLPGLSWNPHEYSLTPDQTERLAMVNGKREIWQNVALNTNLCYSNPNVRDMIINEIVNYIEKQQHIDILHFWLADMYNNQCECEHCQDMIPTDFYVRMLNELDHKLTAKQINTRIVFLIYFELLWPPEKEHIHTQDRFILMFAPITRTYSKAFRGDGPSIKIPPYERNQLVFSSSTDENLAYLTAWQKQFKGDSFAFEYHMMWDHYFDPGYYTSAEIIHKDIRNLHELGLHGYMSCQVQRAFFPTGLNMAVMARTLWNKQTNFDEIVDDYYTHAFGEDATLCKDYMKKLSVLFDPPYLRNERKEIHKEQAAQFASITTVILNFIPIIQKNKNHGNSVQAQSWKFLWYHAQFGILYARALEAKALGSASLLNERWKLLVNYIQTIEDEVQSVFDVFEFIHVMRSKVMNEFKFL